MAVKQNYLDVLRQNWI